MKTGTLRIAPIAHEGTSNGQHPVMVSVIGSDGVVHQTELYTNANGTHSTSLPEGQYTVQFEGRGLQTLIKRGVRVVENGATQVIAGPMIPGDGHTVVRYNEHDARSRQTRMILGLVGYYIVLLLFAFWLLLDVWSNDFKFLKLLAVSPPALTKPLLKTVGFTMIGGLFGGVLYSNRQLFKHYCRGNFDPRWLGKYITGPIEGMVLATLVIALLRGGIVVLGGAPDNASAANNFAALAVGGLVGFGIREVIGWLGNLAQSTFPTNSRVGNRDKEETRHA